MPTDASAGLEFDQIKDAIKGAPADPSLGKFLHELALFSAKTFADTGEQLHLFGHVIGPDRKDGKSPFGHGSDETVGVAVLLEIAGQLVGASATLLVGGLPYAGAALLRQVVEVEYLFWAFEYRHKDAERWLRCDKDEREKLFRPAKLRAASNGTFRSKDYGYHCELGGHPVPQTGAMLVSGADWIPPLLLSDLLGHSGRIWNHFYAWARKNEPHGSNFATRARSMADRYKEWKEVDPLYDLPPP